jgi:hypothetical protein
LRKGNKLFVEESENDPSDEGLIPDQPDGGEAPESAEDRLVSQKELDKIIQRRLKRQEEQFLKKYADYDDRVSESENFRKLQSEKATDAERWEKEREKLLASLQERDTELTKLQRSNLIADLASEKGLPKSFWKRVQGDNEESIAEDMDSIIKDLGLDKPGDAGKETTPKAPKKGAVYGGGGETEDPDPDTDTIVSNIPRGPQIRIDNKHRAYK